MTSNGYQRILERVIKLKNKESLVHETLKYQFQWKLFLTFFIEQIIYFIYYIFLYCGFL